MIPGFGGYLISESFLEARAQSAPHERLGQEEIRRRLSAWRLRGRFLGPASSLRALLESAAFPLADALGFELKHDAERVAQDVMAAPIRSRDQIVAIVATPWGHRLDPLWGCAVAYAMRHGASWALLFNGTHLRLVDAERPYSRRYAEFDLDLVVDDDRARDALWQLVRAERFLPSDAGRPAPIRALVDASELHVAGVSKSLKNGVLTASAEILRALVAGGRDGSNAIFHSFDQALTIVYRLLFLLFAEGRGLVPLWHPVYRESYSIESLRKAVEQTDGAVGLWDAIRAISRLAHAGCEAGDLHVTPFNGRLFAPVRTPLADRRGLDDRAAQRAVAALTTRTAPDRAGREPIGYRDLGVEQLGAVYETLLDYEPVIDGHTVELRSGSGTRKASGTFYTPQPLAQYLVSRTLAPLVRDAEPARILALRVLDPAMGSGAFLVAACSFLASAYEQALVRQGGYHPTDFGEAERTSIRRTIAERCLYGVDLNPMAVQLARLSLWLTTLAADRPLTFLDHRLQTGDSLLGAWISTLRRPPAECARSRRAPGTLPLFDDDRARSCLAEALPVRFSLEGTPDDTIEQVRSKERALATLEHRGTELSKWKRIADLWCARWFTDEHARLPASSFGAISDCILGVDGVLTATSADRYIRPSEQIAAELHFFHWELEFPEVFFDRSGARLVAAGFDAVLGNPPWDMIRADAGSENDRRIGRRRTTSVVRFTRDSGTYTAQSAGHANRYQLFLERAIALTRSGGRIGLVLPSGLATDYGSARLRAHLLSRCDVDALVGFDNQRAVFPIHRSVRFLLMTATAGSPTRTIACRLGEKDPGALDALVDEIALRFPVTVTPALLERLSGPELTIPDFRCATDLAIAERAVALFPPLGSNEGWGVRFGRELNATEDRRFFRPVGSGLPVVEGKQIEPFRVDLAASRYAYGAVAETRPRLAYRDIASATNRQTLIAAILPSRCISTHTVLCLKTPLPMSAQFALCGLFNSFILNYLVRLRVTTHVTTATVERLPVPRPDDSPGAFRQIAALARTLSRRHGPAASARLEAIAASLYQLTMAEFEHVLGTFPLVPRETREAALAAYATEAQRARR